MMDRFYGFDLGDAESAISRLKKDGDQTPEMLSVAGQKSFITAYAVLNNGDLVIGENACYTSGAKKRRIRFKSRFLTDRSVTADVKSFAAGVLGEMYGHGDLIKNDDCCFYVGCPAGWNRNERERYREIFEKTGFPPVRIISESRAALVSACQSKHLQVGYDILAKPVLVVDIGSSTTDFAYVCGGKEVDIQTAGEVRLGGGIMDEILLDECVEESAHADEIRGIFAESEPWQSLCEFTARRLKEKYFSEEEYWENHPCQESIMIQYDRPVRLTLTMSPERAEHLLEKKVARLENRSFREVFEQSLRNVKSSITGETPDLLFLTGGVSKLPAIRSWCEEIFPDSVIVSGAEPEFSVARGLAWCGHIDEELRSFRAELEELKRSTIVEDIVRENIPSLYRAAVDSLAEPIIRNAAMPVFLRWRDGEIRKLADADGEIRTAIESYLHSDEARELLVKPITGWLKPVSDRLEVYTVPICIKHNIPYSAMSLRSYLAASDVDIKIEAKDVLGLEWITWLIDSIVSLMVGLLCGGSGIALISSGVPGIIIGFAASFLLLALGRKQMEHAVLEADLPKPLRKIVPRNLYEARAESLISEVREKLYDSFENEKDEEITARLVDEISEQIETCLTKMAEVVEIPLG